MKSLATYRKWHPKINVAVSGDRIGLRHIVLQDITRKEFVGFHMTLKPRVHGCLAKVNKSSTEKLNISCQTHGGSRNQLPFDKGNRFCAVSAAAPEGNWSSIVLKLHQRSYDYKQDTRTHIKQCQSNVCIASTFIRASRGTGRLCKESDEISKL